MYLRHQLCVLHSTPHFVPFGTTRRRKRPVCVLIPQVTRPRPLCDLPNFGPVVSTHNLGTVPTTTPELYSTPRCHRPSRRHVHSLPCPALFRLSLPSRNLPSPPLFILTLHTSTASSLCRPDSSTHLHPHSLAPQGSLGVPRSNTLPPTTTVSPLTLV